jgi:HSP20 family molecular chaperone IbpA
MFTSISDPWTILSGTAPALNQTYSVSTKNPSEKVLYVKAPGYGQDDLVVELHDGILTIRGTLPEDRVTSNLVTPKIDLAFELNRQFKVENASMQNGILAIHMVREDRSEPIRIPVLTREH